MAELHGTSAHEATAPLSPHATNRNAANKSQDTFFGGRTLWELLKRCETSHKTHFVVCRTLWELLRGKVVPKARRRWGGFFHNDAEHRDFTAIGTAAGWSGLLCWWFAFVSVSY